MRFFTPAKKTPAVFLSLLLAISLPAVFFADETEAEKKDGVSSYINMESISYAGGPYIEARWDIPRDTAYLTFAFSPSRYFVDSWAETVPNIGEFKFAPYNGNINGLKKMYALASGYDKEGKFLNSSDVYEIYLGLGDETEMETEERISILQGKNS